MGQFAEIRPFNDNEVSPVIERLLSNRELIAAMASLRLGSWHKYFSFIVYPLVARVLRKQLEGIKDVRDFQLLVKHYMDGMVDSTTTGFSLSGLDELGTAKAFLFMSNHRDIALDPAFVNYSLYQKNLDTVRIAIGDNLLTKSWVSDLMRMNKSFIVKRSAKAPRQMLAAFKLLSGYIRHSIEEDGNPVWIAQREGRAKDGNDRTEPAIIKMIAMSQKRKEESLSDFIGGLNVVPVAISYELDPCDGAKAKELYEAATHGSYEKGEDEDVASIGLGISGDKGHVHVAFGTPLSGEFDGPEQVAAEVDRQVIENYVLHPSNYFAYKMLHGNYPVAHPALSCGPSAKPFAITGLEQREREFQTRIEALPAEHRDYALGIYANTIDRKLQLVAEQQAASQV